MTRKIIAIFNADSDAEEFLDCNLANFTHGVIFASKIAQSSIDLRTYTIHANNFPPSEKGISGIIITGSGTNILSGQQHLPLWVKNLIHYIQSIKTASVLGVCFGHQLLAIATCGTVERLFGAEKDLPVYELGYPEIRLTDEGKKSVLFQGISPVFRANESRQNQVTKLPPGATLLATNSTGIQAMQVRPGMWGIQFHPEIYPHAAIRSLDRRINDRSTARYRQQFIDAKQHIPQEYALSKKNESVKIYENFIKYVCKK